MVIGLSQDTTKRREESRYNTFCDLCRRRIRKGEVVYTWPDKRFMVHLECSTTNQRVDNVFFRQYVKRKKKRRAAS